MFFQTCLVVWCLIYEHRKNFIAISVSSPKPSSLIFVIDLRRLIPNLNDLIYIILCCQLHRTGWHKPHQKKKPEARIASEEKHQKQNCVWTRTDYGIPFCFHPFSRNQNRFVSIRSRENTAFRFASSSDHDVYIIYVLGNPKAKLNDLMAG